MDKSKVAALCNKQRKQSSLDAQYNNTQICEEFYNGDSMSYRSRIQYEDPIARGKKRANVEFNKVQPPVDAVVGFMAQNRRQAKYVANVQDQEQQIIFSKNMNAYNSYHRQNANMDQIETEMDRDMLVNGYAGADTDLSYIIGNATTDPNGEIVQVKIDCSRLYWDTAARMKNMLDARWAGYSEDYYLKDALSLFEGSKEEDFEPISDAINDDDKTGYEYNPWGGLYDKIRFSDTVEWVDQKQEKVRVYNHQWFEYETFYKCDNPIYLAETPEDAMFYKMSLDIIASQIKPEGPDGIEVNDLFKFDPLAETLTMNEKTKQLVVKDFGDLVKPVGFKRKVFYTAVFSGSHVFTCFRSISQQGFSIKFKSYHFDASRGIWVGMVNAMMQPVEYFNKAMTEFLFTIAARSKGGVIIEEDAVENIAEFESKIAKTDAVAVVLSGAISGGKIMFKEQGAQNTGLDQVMQIADQSIKENSVDPSFVGDLNDKDMSGIFLKRRIRQVISKLGRPFDALTLYQKELARLMLDLIPVWVQNNQGGAVHITGEDGFPQFLEVSENAINAEYSVSIQEAPQTPEDKQEAAELLGTFADKLLAVDPNAAKSLYAQAISMFNIDGDIKRNVLQTLQPQQDQIDPVLVQQMQQELEQLRNALTQAQVAKLAADADLAAAKAERERGSMTAKDRAETAKALEDAAQTGAENDLLREYGKPSETKMNVSA